MICQAELKTMTIELLYREIHLKKSFAAIPPDCIVYIECGKVIFRPCVCVPNKMVKLSQTPTKSVGKQLFGGDQDDYNKCVCFMGEGRGTPHRHGTSKVIDLIFFKCNFAVGLFLLLLLLVNNGF